ncbi:MAG TPA: hypothetical protein PLN69_01875 [bacterium]|nr:hypothetical protein [bacterium]
MNKFLVLTVCIFLFSFVSASASPAGAQVGSEPDAKKERLCAEAAAPDDAPDKMFINCEIERADFAPEYPPMIPGMEMEFRVVAFNIERGYNIDRQIETLKNNPDMRNADLLLISEADRGCRRTGYRNTARELARELRMNYAYGVEFMELERYDEHGEICEHGNAIMSRHPLIRVEQIRHEKAAGWYEPPGEKPRTGQPRLGGRMAMMAEVDFGGTVIRAYSVHFESSLLGDKIRKAEASRLMYHARSFEGPVIIGGDMNTGLYLGDLVSGGRRDPTTQFFFKKGYADAHAGVDPALRGSCEESGMWPVLDLIMSRGAKATSAGVCATPDCRGLSDHLPVWATFSF